MPSPDHDQQVHTHPATMPASTFTQRDIINREFDSCLSRALDPATRHEAIDLLSELVYEVILADLLSATNVCTPPAQNKSDEVSVLDLLRKIDSLYDRHTRTSVISKQRLLRGFVEEKKFNKSMPLTEYLLFKVKEAVQKEPLARSTLKTIACVDASASRNSFAVIAIKAFKAVFDRIKQNSAEFVDLGFCLISVRIQNQHLYTMPSLFVRKLMDLLILASRSIAMDDRVMTHLKEIISTIYFLYQKMLDCHPLVSQLKLATCDTDILTDLLLFDFIAAMTISPLCGDIMSPFIPLVELCLSQQSPCCEGDVGEDVNLDLCSSSRDKNMNGPGLLASLYIFGVLVAQMPSAHFVRFGKFLLNLSSLIWNKFRNNKLRINEFYLCFLINLENALLSQLNWSFCEQGVLSHEPRVLFMEWVTVRSTAVLGQTKLLAKTVSGGAASRFSPPPRDSLTLMRKSLVLVQLLADLITATDLQDDPAIDDNTKAALFNGLAATCDFLSTCYIPHARLQATQLKPRVRQWLVDFNQKVFSARLDKHPESMRRVKSTPPDLLPAIPDFSSLRLPPTPFQRAFLRANPKSVHDKSLMKSLCPAGDAVSQWDGAETPPQQRCTETPFPKETAGSKIEGGKCEWEPGAPSLSSTIAELIKMSSADQSLTDLVHSQLSPIIDSLYSTPCVMPPSSTSSSPSLGHAATSSALSSPRSEAEQDLADGPSQANPKSEVPVPESESQVPKKKRNSTRWRLVFRPKTHLVFQRPPRRRRRKQTVLA